MDLVARLILGLSLLFSGSAFASQATVIYVVFMNGTEQSFTTASSACSYAFANGTNTAFSFTGIEQGSDRVYCVGQRSDGYTTQVYDALIRYSCSTGEVGNAPFECPAVPNNCPPAGTVEGDSSNAYVASSIFPTICIGEGSQGCVWKPGGTVPAVCANGKCYQWGPFTATGGSCDPSSTLPGAPESAASAPKPAADCASKGQCPGLVNGTAVCVACGKSSTTSSASSSASGPGAGSGPGSGSGSTGSGSGGIGGTPLKCVGPDCVVNTTKTTETVCEGAQCTTTTKTTVTASSPSGGVSGGSSGSTTGDSSTKTEAETKDKDSFCIDNPKSVLCKDALDSKWGGACDGGFTCDGDAVQCAQSQASWKAYCEAKVTPENAIVIQGQNSMNGDLHPGSHPYLDPTAIDFSSGVSGVVNAINPFGGSCPSDLTFQVMGTSVVVPLSDACPVLRIMGLVAVAFTTFACAFIQLGALKSL